MTSKNSIILFGLFSVLLLVLVGAINYSLDPQCYYRCETVEPSKKTLNTYYQAAQRVLAFPETELIILGSSRGETTPPLWIEKETGLKTLNLSVSGAELITKLTLLKIAEENAKLKKVIWLADYFDLIGESTDSKIKNTPALRKYFLSKTTEEGVQQKIKYLQSLIDHNTLEASLHFIGNREATTISKGAGSELRITDCESEDFKGKESAESLRKEVDLLYQNYAHGVLKPLQNPDSLKIFSDEMKRLRLHDVDVIILITPYHPEFLTRLKNEYPDIFEKHQKWIKALKSLETDGIKVVDSFQGMDEDDGSPKYWNDGVHFTCHYSIKMLSESL
ncbi:hypothetical protein AZI85_16100 [Bdellovibrio bacteriovorus]|uniref:Uncharacterized protein n=1 Tax=Bdellovibrio bacteriovorus TaxID=959 RepID=A0A150WTW3_BDEBC|nr:hypothetical protein [Bdellovibrio bacteriovorus]KYG69915.1 hypothetical protein AZI85_16100 [Bdellovibrio bacteriovorus]